MDNIRIIDATEVLTDGVDIVKEFFTINVILSDGTPASLEITLGGAIALRAILDAVPELDGRNW